MSRVDDSENTGGPDSSSGRAATRRRRRWLWIGIGGLCVVLAVAVWLGSNLGPSLSRDRLKIADVSSERLLGDGSVVGIAAEFETHAWLGIRYARPPVDDERWRAPSPPVAWADTYDALQRGSACAQVPSRIRDVPGDASESVLGSEDCLFLNIWAPRAEPDAVPRGRDRMPVMVWIHGGGNVAGHAGPMYDGARLAGSENVIVVSLNYRLGPFGWFSHAALRNVDGPGPGRSGNFGTLDQIHALRWIRDNIADFGGDPDNLTIFGASAGGRNVMALMLAPAARGLFHRAVIQSGATGVAGAVTPAAAENYADDPVEPGDVRSAREVVAGLFEAAGVVPDRDAARGYADEIPDDELVSFLRGRSTREILDAYRVPESMFGIEAPTLFADGRVLPKGDWIDALARGQHVPIPVILGSTRDEARAELALDDEYVSTTLGLWRRIRDKPRFVRMSKYQSDLRKWEGVDRPASALISSGSARVYGYRFDWDEEPSVFGMNFGDLLGATQGLELPFLFGTFDLGDALYNRLVFSEQTSSSRDLLAQRMMGYWAEFARSGQPGRGNREDLPEWLPWAEADAIMANLMILDTEEGGGIRLAQGRLSRDQIIASIDSEAELHQREKCEIFFDLFSREAGWDLEEYRRMGQVGCAEHPPTSF